ncbi:MAG: response regulator [Pricia sp.]
MPKYDKIGIVDDDAIAVFGMKRALMAIGLTPELLIFENGEDALEAFKKWLSAGETLPSPLFIDLNMPVMDGWDLVSELHLLISSKKQMPEIFIMTSSIDHRDIEKAKIYGLEANYLIKPVSGEDLKRVLG